MLLDKDGFTVWAEPWKNNREPVMYARAKVPVEPHIENFLECVRTRREPNCPVEVAAEAVSGPHLANVALFSGRKVTMEEASG
ncbi:MAG TPA: hypothetical protein ENJ62_06860 [Bryobacterales bacterium]|nr:hypothetical protein [Bryobacterales bacterium]